MGFQTGFLRSTYSGQAPIGTGARCGVASHRTTYIEHIADRAFSGTTTNVHKPPREGSVRDLRHITLAKLYVVTWAKENSAGSRSAILSLEGTSHLRVLTTRAQGVLTRLTPQARDLCWLWVLSSAGWLYRA